MYIFELILIAWLVLLTGAGIYGGWRLSQLSWRHSEMDLADQLHYIQRQITMEKVRKDERLEAALRAAIRCFEENRLLADKYWGEYQALKQFMQQ